jgi:integrase/recombinase XerD
MTIPPPSASGWTEAFLEMMAVERAAAANTLKAYERDLADAAAFLKQKGHDLATTSATLIESHFADLGARGLSPATAASAPGGGAPVLPFRLGRRLAAG